MAEVLLLVSPDARIAAIEEVDEMKNLAAMKRRISSQIPEGQTGPALLDATMTGTKAKDSATKLRHRAGRAIHEIVRTYRLSPEGRPTRRDIDRLKKRPARDREPPKQHTSGEQPWNSLVNLSVVPATQAVRSPQSEDWQAALTTIGSLSLSIIHDLRNPVAAIYASAETLICVESLPHQIKRLATNIHRASERLSELLTDLSGILPGNRPKAETCDIRDIIAAASDAALAARENNGVRMLHDLPQEIKVPLQRSRMQRVFFNLITNAIEAMPYGGEIRISASTADGYVLVNVEDTGPGIPRRIRERLFEPFATADKRDGLGLGLALARQTVLDHGGEIWIEPAAGCRFAIRLPLH